MRGGGNVFLAHGAEVVPSAILGRGCAEGIPEADSPQPMKGFPLQHLLTALHLAIGGIIPLAAKAPAPELTSVSPRDLGASVVRIEVTDQEADYRSPWNPGHIGGGIGSGFVIEIPGRGRRILTNAHVVSNARFLSLTREGVSRPYSARVEFIAHDCDLALVVPEDPSFLAQTRPLELGGLPAIESGVSVYGYPLGGERLSVTRGVVSKIDFDLYTHSGVDTHLVVQIDAAINPGNSGGPVLQDGRVVGVAFQGYSGDVAQNMGFMIPVPVIARFLKDLSKGSYSGYVDLSIGWREIPNPVMRRALGLPDNDRGILVTDVQEAGSSGEYLRKGDILLAVDGLPISSDGRVLLEGESVDMSEVVERKLAGDSVKFDLLRDGNPLTLSYPLSGTWPFHMQATAYEETPRFLVHGGLVFQPLNRNLLPSIAGEDPLIRWAFDGFTEKHLFLERPEIVVLTRILRDPVNRDADGLRPGIVDTVNGKKIRSLRELQEAFVQPARFDVITLVGSGEPIVLSRDEASASDHRVRATYGLPSTSSASL